jgi:hypothetical protein
MVKNIVEPDKPQMQRAACALTVGYLRLQTQPLNMQYFEFAQQQ